MNKTQEAVFAAGCFWGVQYYFDQVPGITKTAVGYTGGKLKNPSYEAVCRGDSGHAEAVKIEYDPKLVTYQTLLKHFFRMHDPTQHNRQGPDIGSQYRSAIFCVDGYQKAVASKAIEQLISSGNYGKPIATTLEPYDIFWNAEDYHQKFTERTGRGVCHIPYEPV